MYFPDGLRCFLTAPSWCQQFHSQITRIKYAEFPGIGMKQLLPKLTARLQPLQRGPGEALVPEYKQVIPKESNEIITHSWLWPRVGAFFKPKDVIIAETGLCLPLA
jgi:pyruvate decarboxylase